MRQISFGAGFLGHGQSRFELEMGVKWSANVGTWGKYWLASSEKEVGESKNNQYEKYHTTFWFTIPLRETI